VMPNHVLLDSTLLGRFGFVVTVGTTVNCCYTLYWRT
jgi:hypothetical protein